MREQTADTKNYNRDESEQHPAVGSQEAIEGVQESRNEGSVSATRRARDPQKRVMCSPRRAV